MSSCKSNECERASAKETHDPKTAALREQVRMLRDALRPFADHAQAATYPAYRAVIEALAATEPKP